MNIDTVISIKEHEDIKFALNIEKIKELSKSIDKYKQELASTTTPTPTTSLLNTKLVLNEYCKEIYELIDSIKQNEYFKLTYITNMVVKQFILKQIKSLIKSDLPLEMKINSIGLLDELVCLEKTLEDNKYNLNESTKSIYNQLFKVIYDEMIKLFRNRQIIDYNPTLRDKLANLFKLFIIVSPGAEINQFVNDIFNGIIDNMSTSLFYTDILECLSLKFVNELNDERLLFTNIYDKSINKIVDLLEANFRIIIAKNELIRILLNFSRYIKNNKLTLNQILCKSEEYIKWNKISLFVLNTIINNVNKEIGSSTANIFTKYVINSFDVIDCFMDTIESDETFAVAMKVRPIVMFVFQGLNREGTTNETFKKPTYNNEYYDIKSLLFTILIKLVRILKNEFLNEYFGVIQPIWLEEVKRCDAGACTAVQLLFAMNPKDKRLITFAKKLTKALLIALEQKSKFPKQERSGISNMQSKELDDSKSVSRDTISLETIIELVQFYNDMDQYNEFDEDLAPLLTAYRECLTKNLTKSKFRYYIWFYLRLFREERTFIYRNRVDVWMPHIHDIMTRFELVINSCLNIDLSDTLWSNCLQLIKVLIIYFGANIKQYKLTLNSFALYISQRYPIDEAIFHGILESIETLKNN